MSAINLNRHDGRYLTIYTDIVDRFFYEHDLWAGFDLDAIVVTAFPDRGISLYVEGVSLEQQMLWVPGALAQLREGQPLPSYPFEPKPPFLHVTLTHSRLLADAHDVFMGTFIGTHSSYHEERVRNLGRALEASNRILARIPERH